MPPKETINSGVLYFYNEKFGEYEKIGNALDIGDTYLDGPDVVRDLNVNESFTATIKLKQRIVADVPYKEVSND